MRYAKVLAPNCHMPPGSEAVAFCCFRDAVRPSLVIFRGMTSSARHQPQIISSGSRFSQR